MEPNISVNPKMRDQIYWDPMVERICVMVVEFDLNGLLLLNSFPYGITIVCILCVDSS